MAENTTNQDNNLGQGGSTGKTNSFMKGMIKDASEIFVPEGVWTNAINAINISHKGDEGVIGNEQSNLYCTTAPYTIIGILHKYKTEWVVFSTNNVSSEIGTFDEADCTYTTLINDSCLNFNTKYMITGAVKYNADCTYSVYWADGNNPDRTLNLDPTRIPYICNPQTIDVNKVWRLYTISRAAAANPCGVATNAGGAGITNTVHALGTNYGVVTITYNMQTIPDKLEVWFDADPATDPPTATTGGPVSGTGSISFNKFTLTSTCYVRVTGPNGTVWSYTVNCPVVTPETPPMPVVSSGILYTNDTESIVEVPVITPGQTLGICALVGSIDTTSKSNDYTVSAAGSICYEVTETIVDPDACGAEICTNRIDCEQLRLHPLVNQPCITVNTSVGAGQLQNGSYQAVVAYSYNGIKLTDYSTPSQPQALWDHSGVGGSIDINVSNLDLNFEEYELVVISVINQQTIAKKIGNYSTMQSSVHLDLYLESLITVPLFQIPLKSQIYEKSKKMFSLNGYLIRTSVTTQPYFNYQPFANDIKAEWVSVKYPADYYWKKGNTVGYMRDEVYPFFIRWVYTTGARSASFHIPGREAISTDLVTLPSSNTDIVDPLQNKVWNVYDTSTSVGYEGGTSRDGGIILQRGNMSYWESTELYPNKHPEIWGDLCNKPIRHHKMPSNETTHIHADDGNSIIVLGVQFNNIKHPIDIDGNPIQSISGYEILRGSREGNRSIVAKGMFNNMLEFNIQGSTSKGLMQNYPYNDLRTSGGNDPYLNGVSPRKDIFSFHSPETTIIRPYLGAGVYSKIYTEESGDAKGSFVIPYKHPKEKLLTNFGFGFAVIVATGIGLVSMLGKSTTTTSNTGKFTFLGLNVPGTPASAGESDNVIVPWALAAGTGTNALSSSQIARNPLLNFDTTTSTSTEGGPGNALGNLTITQVNAASTLGTASVQNNVQAAADILNIISIVSTGVFYFYEGLEIFLDILYKFIPFKDYVIQSNSHAFYNTFSKVVNNLIPGSVNNPSMSRKLNTTKYTSSGLQDLNANFRINNLYRNKFVTVQLNKDLQNPINQDLSKMTASSIGINNEYTTRTVAYYGALKLDYQNQYGQIQSVVQIPTDSCVYKTESVLNRTHFTGPIFGGDVYINRYTEKNMYAFFNTWAYDLPDDTPFNYRLYNNGPEPKYKADFRHFKADDFDIDLKLSITNPIDFNTPSDLHDLDDLPGSNGIFSVKNKAMYLFNNGVRDFFTESELNMAFRDYGENEWEKFYDVYGNSFNDLNTMFRSDLITRPIYYKYDLSLSTSKLYNNFASWASVLPPDYDPVLYDTCYQYFPYRGIYSLQQQDGLKRDNWRNFLPLNYYTFEGVVTNIKSVNSSGALILYEDFTPSQFVGVDTLKTDAGTKVTIGDGGLFANNIQSLANAEDVLDYGASISSRATLNTPYGLFYVSQKAGKIIQYGGEGLQEISKSGMKNWFLQNLPSELLKSFPNFTEYDNPIDGIAVQAVYDAQYELLYFTKKDYKPKSNCIGYTPELGFYDKCNCPNTCPTGFTLNIETGMCEKTVDTPRCQAGFSYNSETGNCEAIVRTVASCPVDNE